MASNREDKIIPTKLSSKIAIPKDQWKRFKDVFWNDSVYKFHVNDKYLQGNNIILLVRSMRVNEFVDILDENGINWSYLSS